MNEIKESKRTDISIGFILIFKNNLIEIKNENTARGIITKTDLIYPSNH
jgi:hypothetical protein